jgi:hypothetical protein
MSSAGFEDTRPVFFAQRKKLRRTAARCPIVVSARIAPMAIEEVDQQVIAVGLAEPLERFEVAVIEHEPSQRGLVALARVHGAPLDSQRPEEAPDVLAERITAVALVVHVELRALLRGPFSLSEKPLAGDS